MLFLKWRERASVVLNVCQGHLKTCDWHFKAGYVTFGIAKALQGQLLGRRYF